MIKRENNAADAREDVSPSSRERLRALLDRARSSGSQLQVVATVMTEPADDGYRKELLERALPPRHVRTKPTERSSTMESKRGASEPMKQPALLPTPGHAAAHEMMGPPTTSALLSTPTPALLPTPTSALLPTPTSTLHPAQSTTTTVHLPHHELTGHPHVPSSLVHAPSHHPAYMSSVPVQHSCTCPHHGHSYVYAPPTHIPVEYHHGGLVDVSSHWSYHSHAPPSVVIPQMMEASAYTYTHGHDQQTVMQSVSANLEHHMAATTISPTVSSASSAEVSAPKAKRAEQQPKKSDRAPKLSERPPKKATQNSALGSLDEYEDYELHGDYMHTVHMFIPSDSMGCLIGRGGDIIRDINAASDCTLSIRTNNAYSQEDGLVLRLYGRAKGICLAQRMVIERIRSHRASKKDPSYMELVDDLLVRLSEDSITTGMLNAVTDTDEDEDVDLDEQSVLKWLVHKDDIGKIMGQGGRILKAIARDSNTKLSISSIEDMGPGGTERVVSISGTREDIEVARSMIERNAGGRPESEGSNSKGGDCFAIPYQAAGFLIGKQGSRIRRVSEESGARIQIPAQQDLPLGAVNRILHIQGSKQQTARACSLLRSRLKAYLNSPDASNETDEIVLKLILPQRICSCLLDQRGRLIREINEKADAHARFLPPLDDESRVCVIFGEPSKAFRAQRLILQFIAGDAITNKRTGAEGAAPRKRKRDVADSDSDTESTSRGGRPIISASRPRRPASQSSRVVHMTSHNPRQSTAAQATGRKRSRR